MSKASSVDERRMGEFQQLVRRIEYLKYTINSLVYWDKITYMPEGGLAYRSQVMSFLGDELYQRFADPKLRMLADYFETKDGDAAAMARRVKRNYSYVNKIPKREYADYIALTATAEQVWEQARAARDISLFVPYLERMVSCFRRFADCWGYKKDSYDAWMGYYEEGATTEKIDAQVAELKTLLLGLLAQIQEKEARPALPAEVWHMDLAEQQAFSEELLRAIGFSFAAGRLDVGGHPTTLSSSPGDVRIVTAFDPADLRVGVFNTLHEGGMGLYEQDIDVTRLGTLTAEVASFGTEEAVARLYENIIGRSLGFWKRLYPSLQEKCPGLAAVPLEDFHREINRVGTSLIRIQADELTYTLHLIIRYELEKRLIHGTLAVADLPDAWAERYRAYLGVTPAHDGEGVLQDIHWAAGYFGYFPSYFTANLMSAQFAGAMERDLGPLDEALARGRLCDIRVWLKERIHHWGARYSPAELVERATGAPLSSQPYMSYLRTKYTEVYRLDKTTEEKVRE